MCNLKLHINKTNIQAKAMAFDSIDKIFNEMLRRYAHLFEQDMFGFPPRSPPSESDLEPGERGLEEERGDLGLDQEPRTIGGNFGYEIISGSGMKEPIIRIYGSPGEFPDEQGLPMLRVEPAEFETPVSHPGESPTKEPFSETFKEKDGSVTVNVDLPGIDAPDVSLTADGETLRLEAHGDNRHYQKSIHLESPVESEKLSWRLNNGVLEIRIPPTDQ